MLLNCGVGEDSWESLGLPRRSNQSILKEICPGCSLEGLMLKLKLQYFGYLMQRANSFEKTLMLEKTEGRKKGMTEDEMVGWHHWLNGHGIGWTPGVGDGQGGLACCGSWGRKESDTTERLNWTELSQVSTLSSVIPFSCCLQSFPASGSFPMSQFFASGGPSIGASASASVLPMNIQDWFL